LGGRGRQFSEFEASLINRVSSKTARATQRNPVSQTNKERIIMVTHFVNIKHKLPHYSFRKVKKFEESFSWTIPLLCIMQNYEQKGQHGMERR
jgi:nicotinamide mononucleotide adenylyltransferase